MFVHGRACADDVLVDIPLRFATLGSAPVDTQVGKSIVVTDLARADREISTVLLNGLQDMGLAIEAPPLNLDGFLAEKVAWRTSKRELPPNWIADHNASGAGALPGKRIYAVQYLGQYQYNGPTLRLVLTVWLFERSRFGAFQRTTVPYSSQFFADRLERAILARLTK
jgi:hypothetical protein